MTTPTAGETSIHRIVEQIRRKSFPLDRKGYAVETVDAYLAELASDLERFSSTMTAAPPERYVAPAPSRQIDLSNVGTEVAAILDAAKVAAERIEQEASNAAATIRSDAALDAERERREALEAAEAIRSEAGADRQQAASELEEARAVAASELTLAREELETVRAAISEAAAAIDRRLGEAPTPGGPPTG
jgi:DivIVA domain-containing protein